MRQDEQNAYETIMTRLRPAIERWSRGDPFAYAALCAEDVTFEILNPKMDFHGDIGILTYNLNEYASEGPPSYRWNTTEVYRRTDTEWRIIHAHWSPIPKPQSA